MQSCSSSQSTTAWTGSLPCRMTAQKQTFKKVVVVVVVPVAVVVEYSASYCLIDVL